MGLSGCGGKPQPPTNVAQVGPMEVRFEPQPNPPSVGLDTSFVVKLAEAGSPVTDARVRMQLYCISAGQAGPAADATSTSPGEYQFLDLVTGFPGRWKADLAIQRPGAAPAAVSFPFNVNR